jgi:hypothetical protein
LLELPVAGLAGLAAEKEAFSAGGDNYAIRHDSLRVRGEFVRVNSALACLAWFAVHLIRPLATFPPSDAEKEFILWGVHPIHFSAFQNYNARNQFNQTS